MSKEKLLLMVLSKLKAESAEDLTTKELNRCFKGCLRPNIMLRYANQFICEGELTLDMLK